MNQILTRESQQKLRWCMTYSANEWRKDGNEYSVTLEDATVALLRATGENINKLQKSYKSLENDIKTFETILSKKLYLESSEDNYGHDTKSPKAEALNAKEFVFVSTLMEKTADRIRMEEAARLGRQEGKQRLEDIQPEL